MAEFIISTSDGTYTWDAATGDENNTVNSKFELENNNDLSDTQGYMRKKQEGYNRVKATVIVALSREEYEDTFAPMLVYPDYCGDLTVFRLRLRGPLRRHQVRHGGGFPLPGSGFPDRGRTPLRVCD